MDRPSTRHDEPGSAGWTKENRGWLLRVVLKLDAAASGALGVLLLAAAPVLDGLLGAPATLLAPVGLFLVAWAGFLCLVASRRRISKTAVRVVILFNLAWVVDSAVVAAAGWFPFTALGLAFVLAQAGAVVLFAAAQFYALRKTAPAPSAR